MIIGILGATGHIGKTLAIELAMRGYRLVLFARGRERLSDLVEAYPSLVVKEVDDFEDCELDVVINSIGAGDPARLRELGAGIISITEEFDNRVLEYVKDKPSRLYINMSSGAVYGTSFSEPASEEFYVSIPVNLRGMEFNYTLAKLMAEAKHRAAQNLNIIDLRVFSYFSHLIDFEGRFMIVDLANSLIKGIPFVTNENDMVRDFVGPYDLAKLVAVCLERWQKGPVNDALDVYSKAPVGKFELIAGLKEVFRLDVDIQKNADTVTATGNKSIYYSTYRKAEQWGYTPQFSSLEMIVHEMRQILGDHA